MLSLVLLLCLSVASQIPSTRYLVATNDEPRLILAGALGQGYQPMKPFKARMCFDLNVESLEGCALLINTTYGSSTITDRALSLNPSALIFIDPHPDDTGIGCGWRFGPRIFLPMYSIRQSDANTLTINDTLTIRYVYTPRCMDESVHYLPIAYNLLMGVELVLLVLVTYRKLHDIASTSTGSATQDGTIRISVNYDKDWSIMGSVFVGIIFKALHYNLNPFGLYVEIQTQVTIITYGLMRLSIFLVLASSVTPLLYVVYKGKSISQGNITHALVKVFGIVAGILGFLQAIVVLLGILRRAFGIDSIGYVVVTELSNYFIMLCILVMAVVFATILYNSIRKARDPSRYLRGIIIQLSSIAVATLMFIMGELMQVVSVSLPTDAPFFYTLTSYTFFTVGLVVPLGSIALRQ